METGIEWVDGIPFKAPEHEEEFVENSPTGRNLRAETAAWIKAHFEVAELFLKFAKEMASRARRFGVGLIAERVRWQVVFDRGDWKYKFNNNHRAYIARWLIAREPALERYLTFRKVRC